MIAEVLYYIFIYPMQTLLGAVFESIYTYTHSYGWAIVLLSVVINLFLLKLTNLADKKAQKTNALKSICDAKIAEFKKVFRGSELHAYTQTLFKQKHYHPIYNLFSLGGLALQIPFFLGVLFLLQDFESLRGAKFGVIKDLSKPDTLLFGYALLPFAMSALSFISVFISSTDRGARIQGSLIAIIFLVLLYAMPSGLVLYWMISTLCILLKLLWKKRDSSMREAKVDTMVTGENAESVAHKEFTSHAKQSSFLGRFFTCIFTPYAMLNFKTYVTYRNISIFALLNIFFLIFVFSPFAVYSSDVSQFDPNQTFQTLGGLFGFFLLSSFLGIYITSFFYKTPLLKIGVYSVSVILCIGLVYTFLLDYNLVTGEKYAAMEEMMFLTAQGMFHELNKYIDLFIGFLVCILVLLIFLKIKNPFYWFLKITFIALVCSSLIYCQEALSIKGLNTKDDKNVGRDTIGENPNKYLSGFSKNHLNIVVLMLDAFTGSHLEILLDNNPELYQQLDGFVYYNNTTTASSFTFTSLPSVFGGDYYSAYQINQRMPKNLNHERAMAIANIGNAFLTMGFKVGIDLYAIDKNFVNEQINEEHRKNFMFTRDDEYYISLFRKNHDFDLSVLQQEVKHAPIVDSLIAYGIFKFVPYVGRTRVLNPELLQWNIQFGETKASLPSINRATQHIAQLSYLADMPQINADGSPTLKFISNLTSHDSFVLDIDSCKPSLYPNPRLPKFYRDVIPKMFWGKYNSEVCALKELSRLISKLKELQVYDNTILIVVSDHGRDDSYPQLKLVGKNKFPGYYTDTLLLIKQPNTHGMLTKDSRLMINSDVAGIICHYIGGCPNVDPSILEYYPQTREVVHFHPEFFEGSKHPKTHYKLHSLWKVKNNIFDLNNWMDITNIEDKER